MQKSIKQSYDHSSDFLLIFTSSTSKTKTEFPGIFGGDPLAPYPISGGITNLRFSPSHILKDKDKKRMIFKFIENSSDLNVRTIIPQHKYVFLSTFT